MTRGATCLYDAQRKGRVYEPGCHAASGVGFHPSSKSGTGTWRRTRSMFDPRLRRLSATLPNGRHRLLNFSAGSRSKSLVRGTWIGRASAAGWTTGACVMEKTLLLFLPSFAFFFAERCFARLTSSSSHLLNVHCPLLYHWTSPHWGGQCTQTVVESPLAGTRFCRFNLLPCLAQTRAVVDAELESAMEGVRQRGRSCLSRQKSTPCHEVDGSYFPRYLLPSGTSEAHGKACLSFLFFSFVACMPPFALGCHASFLICITPPSFVSPRIHLVASQALLPLFLNVMSFAYSVDHLIRSGVAKRSPTHRARNAEQCLLHRQMNSL